MLQGKHFGGVGDREGTLGGGFSGFSGIDRVAGKAKILMGRMEICWHPVVVLISPVETPKILQKRKTQQLVNST